MWAFVNGSLALLGAFTKVYIVLAIGVYAWVSWLYAREVLTRPSAKVRWRVPTRP
jgi:hypothetical protein